MAKREQRYDSPGISVLYDPSICVHAGNCVRGLPVVFDIRRKRWIDPDRASAQDVAAQIDRCPSGALQYIFHRPDVSTDKSK